MTAEDFITPKSARMNYPDEKGAFSMKSGFFSSLFPFKQNEHKPRGARKAAWAEACALYDQAEAAGAEAQRLLEQYGPELLARRREADASLRRENMDRAIFQSYCGQSGIAFHGELLRTYVEQLLPRETEVHQMWVGAYNSAIEPMCLRLDKLEARQRELEQTAPPPTMEALLEESGYQNFAQYKRIARRLFAQSQQEDDPAPARETAEKLLGLARRSLSFARELRYSCQEQRQPGYVMQNLPLLRAMEEVLSPEAVGRLGTERGWTPGDYREALIRYTQCVTERLLDRFPQPP